jgi:hypothetical protein
MRILRALPPFAFLKRQDAKTPRIHFTLPVPLVIARGAARPGAALQDWIASLRSQ